jgi:hypothetical protein
MVIAGGLPCKRAAQYLGLDKEQVEGAVRLLRHCESLPSPERLALVVQRDPGLDDNDIAEMFGRSAKWSRMVRLHAKELMESEPIPERLEYLDDGLQPGYPTPEQVWAEAARIRTSKEYRTDAYPRSPEPAVLSWRNNAFVPTPFLSSVFA